MNYQNVRKYDLPAIERRGCYAQELCGKHMVVVTMDSTKTVIESENGLPMLDFDNGFYGAIGRGIEKSKAIGFRRDNKSIDLIDLIQVDKKNVKSMEWEKRLEILRLLYANFSEGSKTRFFLPHTWNRALMKVYSDVVSRGGYGLLIRVYGDNTTMICGE